MPCEDEGDDEPGVHLEVGEDAQDGEDFGASVVAVIEDDHGSHAVLLDEGEAAVLDAAHEGAVVACGLGAEGGSDLAAEVSFGEVRDLEVVGAVSGLWERVDEGAQHDCFSDPRRCDDGAAEAMLDDGAHVVGELVVLGVVPAVGDGDLASEGQVVQPEVDAEVDAGGGWVWVLSCDHVTPPRGGWGIPRRVRPCWAGPSRRRAGRRSEPARG